MIPELTFYTKINHLKTSRAVILENYLQFIPIILLNLKASVVNKKGPRLIAALPFYFNMK